MHCNLARTHDGLRLASLLIGVSAVLVLSCGQTDTRAHTQTSMNAILPRITVVRSWYAGGKWTCTQKQPLMCTRPVLDQMRRKFMSAKRYVFSVHQWRQGLWDEDVHIVCMHLAMLSHGVLYSSRCYYIGVHGLAVHFLRYRPIRCNQQQSALFAMHYSVLGVLKRLHN